MAGNSCFYGGVRYSDGAYVCADGIRLRCNDGSWVDTGASCSPNVRQASLEECIARPELMHLGFPSTVEKIPTIKTAKEIANHLVSRLAGVKCCTLNTTPSHQTLELVNTCDERKQATLEFIAGSDFYQTRDFRLNRYEQRIALFPGTSASVIKEGPWDLFAGEDAMGAVSLYVFEPIDSWVIGNGTNRYVCANAHFFYKSNRRISTDISVTLRPSQKGRVLPRIDPRTGEEFAGILISARYEPM